MKEQFSLFYEKNYRQLCYYVAGRIAWKEETEDIVQDTFLLAWQRYEQLLVHPNQVGWLKVVAKHKIYEYARQATQTECAYDAACNVGREESAFYWKELELVLRQCFSKKEQERFVQYYLHGISGKELARREKTTEGNIRVQICRLRRKIMRLL